MHCDYSTYQEYVLEHNYIGTVYEPTCDNVGWTYYECTNCEAWYDGDFKDYTPHNYVAKEVHAATCTDTGLN